MKQYIIQEYDIFGWKDYDKTKVFHDAFDIAKEVQKHQNPRVRIISRTDLVLAEW